MHLKLEKKSFKKLIKNTYKENELIKNILAVSYKQDSLKARRWPK